MVLVVLVVREFGRYPIEHAPSEDPKRERERLLAHRISGMKAEGLLPPDVVEELFELKATGEKESKEREVDDLMAAVREFGRYPIEPLRTMS